MAKTQFTPLQFRNQPHRPEDTQRESPGYDWLEDLDTSSEEGEERPFSPGLSYGGDEAADKGAQASPRRGKEVATSLPEESAASEELERIREEARQEGYNAGFLEGREKGESEGREAMERVQASFLDSFEQALKALTEGEPESLTYWREPLKDLVRTICERVLRTALEEDLAGYLERLVVAALEEMDSGSEVRVILGDVTPGLVEEMRERLAKVPGVESLRLHMEPGQPADFVRIETDYGIIQTTLESQLDRVTREVVQAAVGEE